MRILFTFVGGRGHLEPLLPIARAAERAGHTVAFGCSPAMVSTVEAAGSVALAVGRGKSGAPKRLPFRRVDVEREARELRDRFVRGAARERVPLLVALCDAWKPNVVVRDETDFGAAVAAEILGLPQAIVLTIAAGSFVRPEVIAPALDEVRAEHGLSADPDLALLHHGVVLSPFPTSYRDPAYPLPNNAYSFRPPVLAPVESPIPPWAQVLAGAPVIYFTLGTVFNMESGDLFARVVAGLRAVRANVCVTVGQDIDPSEFGPQPTQVHITRYVPQARVLPHCDLVVSHGGSGSVMGALAHGLPSVLLPLGADQPQNADRCVRLGVAVALDAEEASPASVKEAVTRALEEPSYRENALRMRAEIGALPELSEAVPVLEEFVAGGQAPLPGS